MKRGKKFEPEQTIALALTYDKSNTADMQTHFATVSLQRSHIRFDAKKAHSITSRKSFIAYNVCRTDAVRYAHVMI